MCRRCHSQLFLGLGTSKVGGAGRSKMWITVLVDLMVGFGAFLIADGLIGSRAMRDSFIKAGLAGKDLNKKTENRM